MLTEEDSKLLHVIFSIFVPVNLIICKIRVFVYMFLFFLFKRKAKKGDVPVVKGPHPNLEVLGSSLICCSCVATFSPPLL